MQLRDYQQRAITQLYEWFEAGNKGNPCLVLPTGAGKSHVIAALCKDALQSWPETRVLMTVQSRELIQQNAEKMRQHWPNAPLGIYSAGMGRKQLGEPITFAGIQSIRSKAADIGHIDLVIVDECHSIGHKDEGGYRKFLHGLSVINPNVRVIGLTATPYRLGHGLITDKPAIFDDILEPVTIAELIAKKHLAPLRSKHTDTTINTAGVHKRGGEFIESELQAAVDTEDANRAIVSEVISRAGDRKAWLFFCVGVLHAQHVKEELIAQGIAAECVTGNTPKGERERILSDFKAGKLRALTNANVLTTGFDYPDIDLLAMLRPTMSAALYVQMAGRGMRPKSHTDHCLVLDFAGVVGMHGPITAVTPPKKGNGGDGVVPMKACPECAELIHISVMTCPICGYEFERKVETKTELHNDDIMGDDAEKSDVCEWRWKKHVSRTSGKEMLAVTYYRDVFDVGVTEYFPVTHDGYAGQKARQMVYKLAKDAGLNGVGDVDNLDILANDLSSGSPPAMIEYRKDGKFYRVSRREW